MIFFKANKINLSHSKSWISAPNTSSNINSPPIELPSIIKTPVVRNPNYNSITKTPKSLPFSTKSSKPTPKSPVLASTSPTLKSSSRKNNLSKNPKTNNNLNQSTLSSTPSSNDPKVYHPSVNITLNPKNTKKAKNNPNIIKVIPILDQPFLAPSMTLP